MILKFTNRNLLIIFLVFSLCIQIRAQEFDFYATIKADNLNNAYTNQAVNKNNLIPHLKKTFSSVSLSSTEQKNSPNMNLFGNFGNNIINSFKGNNLYLHLAGIASTYLLVNCNVDYEVQKYFNEHPEYGKWAHPVVYTGMFLPFIAGGGLYAYSKIKNDDRVMGASFAVLQASLIELLYNSTLKVVTGRPHPDWKHNKDMKSLSKTFRFGFLRGGMFWGWPSGHTTTTMAVVSALTNYYPNCTWLKIAGYTLVAYTIFGVSAVNRGGMHWFSDAIAGALMSYAIGSTVGKYYRSLFSSSQAGKNVSINERSSTRINPFGLNFSFNF